MSVEEISKSAKRDYAKMISLFVATNRLAISQLDIERALDYQFPDNLPVATLVKIFSEVRLLSFHPWLETLVRDSAKNMDDNNFDTILSVAEQYLLKKENSGGQPRVSDPVWQTCENNFITLLTENKIHNINKLGIVLEHSSYRWSSDLEVMKSAVRLDCFSPDLVLEYYETALPGLIEDELLFNWKNKVHINTVIAARRELTAHFKEEQAIYDFESCNTHYKKIKHLFSVLDCFDSYYRAMKMIGI